MLHSMDAQEEAEILLKIGRRIRQLRKARKLAQDTLALNCNLTQTFVSQIERGKRNVSVLTLWALAEAMEMTPAQLLEGIE